MSLHPKSKGVKRIDYSIFICDLCNGKQTTELSLFTLQYYGLVGTIKASLWEKHICTNCSDEILDTVNRKCKQ